MVRQTENVNIVEWRDLDAKKFYCYGVLISLSTRTLIYPTQLIKTRFQSQSLSTSSKHKYNSFSDAVRKIIKSEGFLGLYKGLNLNLMQIPVSYLYLTTFEYSKEKLTDILDRRRRIEQQEKHTNNDQKGTSNLSNKNLILTYLISGFIASSLSQIVATPLDVVVQYKQVYHSKNMQKDANIKGKSGLQIFNELYKKDGFLKGFYRGFTVACLFFGIHSGLIWGLYYQMSENIGGFMKRLGFINNSSNNNQISSQSSSSSNLTNQRIFQIISAGITASLITNILLLPLDTIRTRHQLQLKRQKDAKANVSVRNTSQVLYKAEGIPGFFRGWQPRAVQSNLSGILFLAYEYLKVISARHNV